MTTTLTDVSVPLDALRAVVAPVGRATSAERLTGGLFAMTYRVHLDDGRRVVVKTAPTGTDRLLSHEHDLLRAEALVYELAHPRGVAVPRVLLTDWTRAQLPGDAVVVTHLDGVPLAGAELAGDAATTARRGVGAAMARLHAIERAPFGYPGKPAFQGATWREAFGRMVEALLADADRWRVALPAADVRGALDRHGAALDAVTRPALVHTDLWPGNVFVDPASGALTGVIDPERAIFGDPLVDVVGCDPFGRSQDDATLLGGYAQAAGAPLDVDSASARARLALYRLWLAIVMTVERVPREYQGDWVAGYDAEVDRMLAAALAEVRSA
jgi:aminoglycoside phosphotransferase (APT) family kinase protein